MFDFSEEIVENKFLSNLMKFIRMIEGMPKSTVMLSHNIANYAIPLPLGCLGVRHFVQKNCCYWFLGPIWTLGLKSKMIFFDEWKPT